MNHPILGAWELVFWTITTQDSTGEKVSYPFGEQPVGRILYTPDGHMNATIARSDRPDLSQPVPAKASTAEKVAAFDSFFCYGGRFAIDGVEVVHRVELSLNPNFVGSEQRRHMSFEHGCLTLSATETTDKGLKHHSIRWRRA